MLTEDNNSVIASHASEILGVDIEAEELESDEELEARDWDEVAKQERMEDAGEC